MPENQKRIPEEMFPEPDFLSPLKRMYSWLATKPDVVTPLKMIRYWSKPPREKERTLDEIRRAKRLGAYLARFRKAEKARRLERYFAENPVLAFQTALAGAAGLSERQRQYFGSRMSGIYGEYKGQLGQQMRAGVPKERLLKFYSFLEKYPWLEKYASLTPQQLGEYQPQYAPRARFLNY